MSAAALIASFLLQPLSLVYASEEEVEEVVTDAVVEEVVLENQEVPEETELDEVEVDVEEETSEEDLSDDSDLTPDSEVDVTDSEENESNEGEVVEESEEEHVGSDNTDDEAVVSEDGENAPSDTGSVNTASSSEGNVDEENEAPNATSSEEAVEESIATSSSNEITSTTTTTLNDVTPSVASTTSQGEGGGASSPVQETDSSVSTSTGESDEEVASSETSEEVPVSDDDDNEVQEDEPVEDLNTSATTSAPDLIATSSVESADTVETTASSSGGSSVVTTNLNRYQFGENECVAVGDGSFYCSSIDEGNQNTIEKNGVYSARDDEGDFEIYVSVDGESVQLTNNAVDDMSPFYDASSNRVVWHSLVNDRYQIMNYDFETEKTTQLTETSFNNMEPSAYGEITLWQAWMGNDWDIVMYEDGTLTILTVNEHHDLSPHMRGQHVVWQTNGGNEWSVAVYDIESGVTEYIDGGSGSLVENPRFMLVYDAKNDNGDIETIGYDLDKKISVPLAAAAPELPEELPEPDQTGEERALIQSKPNPRDDLIDADDDLDIVPGVKIEQSVATSSTSENAPALVVPSGQASTTLTLDLSQDEPGAGDLVVPAVIQSTTTATTTR